MCFVKQIERDILFAALSCAIDNIGIYPKKTVLADGTQCERTDYQTGWNDCIKAFMATAQKIQTFISSLPDEKKLPLLELILAGDMTLDGDLKIFINVNDVFCHGADSEEISINDIETVYEAYQKNGHDGIIEYAGKRRRFIK